MSETFTRLSPLPAQESQGESVAAPAEVGQGAGTQVSKKPTCRRGTCPPDRMCLACEFPMDFSSLAGAAEFDAPTLEQFQRWLENKAHNAASVIAATEPRFSFSGDVFLDSSLVIADCRAAIKLLMQFNLEQGA